MAQPLRPLVTFVTAAAVCLAAIQPAAARSITRTEYEACQAQDEAGFKTAVEALTSSSLEAALAQVDYKGLVADEWRRGGLDGLIDNQVDIAINEVRDQTSWSQRVQSLWSSDKTKEFATAVSERTFRSDPVKAAFENLSVGISRELGRSLESGSRESAEPARECIRAFLGPRYGYTVARAVSDTTESGLESAATASGTSNPSLGPGIATVGGVTTLALRQVLNRMATRIGQRIVGAVLTRIVSLVGLWVGLGLIAKDIYDSRQYAVDGMLPAIATEMKSPETKVKIRDELVKSVAEQASEHVHEIAVATAQKVVEIWQDYRRGHAKVLELAERYPRMKQLIETLKPDDMPRLDEVVALVLASESEAQLVARLDDGSLARAVTQLPPAALEIARDVHLLAAAFAWNDLAGPLLPKVIAFDLHRQLQPGQLNATTLKRLVAMDERLPIQRLAGLTAPARGALFELSDQELQVLARALPGNELEALAAYLTGLDKPAAQKVLQTVAKEPVRMKQLAQGWVRDAILASRNQLAAVDMMLRADRAFDFALIRQDVQLAASGQVSPLLLLDRHPFASGGLGLSSVVFLLMLRRLFGRRRNTGPTTA